MELIIYKNYFPVLNAISDQRLKSNRLLTVYGFEGQEVMFANHEDEVFVFGRNRFGALGLGHKEDNIKSIEMNRFLTGKQIKNLSFGSKHWIVLTSSGQCYIWGDNTFGQLGAKEVKESFEPQLFEAIKHLNVVKASCGDNHTLVLTSDGLLYGWGHNKFGQLADNKADIHVKPIPIDICEPIKSMSCGLNHSMALTSSGMVFIWGLANEGRLGICNDFRYFLPQLIKGLKNIFFKQIACGPNHSLLLSTGGHIYAFGDNSSGQIGNGSVDIQYNAFKVKSELTFKRIIANKVNDLSLGITIDRKHYVWGLTEDGKCVTPKEVTEDTSGHSMFDIYAKYAKIKITFETIIEKNTDILLNVGTNENEGQFSDKTIDDIISWHNFEIHSPGESFRKRIRLLCKGNNGKWFILITKDDQAYCNGQNGRGCLGFGDNKPRFNQLVRNTSLSDIQLIDIGCGKSHCIGLTKNGICFSWGENFFSQLGIGYIRDKRHNQRFFGPQMISVLSNKKVVQICCGTNHSLALTSDGQVFAWGRNTFGQVGDKSFFSLYFPVKANIDEKISAISCGSCHSLALSVSGKAYAWGLNQHGQLGRPPNCDVHRYKNKAASHTPTTVRGIDFSVKKVVCGPHHTILLTTDGQVFAFGQNDCGQVGNGSTDHQFTPVLLNTRIKIKDIICYYGNNLSLAITEDDRYYVWGLAYNETILRPKLVHISDERSLFDIYLKNAKFKVLFKTIVLNEDNNYIIDMKKSNQRMITKSNLKNFNEIIPNLSYQLAKPASRYKRA